ncbi:MAG: alkaline phosphatase family protein [Desulfohalobiaceae bacterium]
MQILNSKQEPRMLVLGLDGLSLQLARTLCRHRELPGLEYILKAGASSMQPELPELSPVNWTSFSTAAGPEEHGIFGFTSLDPTSYQLRIADSSQVQSPTIFDLLGEKHLQSRVINLPNTYPARPIPGMLISGFVALDLEQAVYPKFLLPRLHQEGYKLDADTNQGAQDPDFLLGELRACLASRQKALDMLWPDLAWNLFVFVLTELDRLGHFLYPALEDQQHPWHQPCMELIQDWDKIICEALNRYQELPEPKRLLVLADHGFVRLKTEVDINTWLKQQGFLRLTGRPNTEWDSSLISPESRAFALDPGRIYVQDSARFSRGRVRLEQKQGLLQDIRAGLQNLSWQGEPVLQDILTGQELYPGCSLPGRPDLILVPRPGFDLKAKFDRDQIFGFYGRYGVHDPGDAIFLDSQGTAAKRVRDAGGKVLEFFEH